MVVLYKTEIQKKSPYIILILVMFLASCTKENAEDLTLQNALQNNIEDSTSIASICEISGLFSTEVKPIIDLNCVRCHKAGAIASSIPLVIYNEIKAVSVDRLLGSIKHEPGFSEMPRSASKLSDCDIETIQKWVDEGQLNN